MKKIILYLTILAATSITSCAPDKDTKQERETVKGDSIDYTQGEGEGEAADEIGS